jgi:hypothetical protein
VLAGVLAVGCLNLVGFARTASAASLCDAVPERCVLAIPTFNHSPYGALDAPTFGSASVRVTGWATDIDSSGPIGVVVTIDGTVAANATASLLRANVGNRGFAVTVPASPASAQVCVTAVNVGLGVDTSLGCAPFPYSTNVSVFDQCGGAVSLPRFAIKWAITPPPTGQVAVETTSSLAGRVGFMSGPSVPVFPVGMSVSDGVSPGPLFRSGPLAALPPGSPSNPSGRLNLAVPCPTGFSVAQLNTLLAGASVPLPPGVTITSSSLTTGFGTATLTANGRATGTVGFVPYNEPFTYSLTFAVTPSMNMMNPSEVVLVNPTGPGTLTFTGGMGWILNPAVAPGLQPTVTSSVVTGLQNFINGLIASNAAAGGAPAGSTVSMARVVITPSGVSLTPVVGWFG